MPARAMGTLLRRRAKFMSRVSNCNLQSLFSNVVVKTFTYTHEFISQVYYKIIMVHILHGKCYLQIANLRCVVAAV